MPSHRSKKLLWWEGEGEEERKKITLLVGVKYCPS